MAFFAVLNGKTVVNTVVADNLETVVRAIGSTCVEYTHENPAYIGGTYDGKKFIPPTTEEPTE